MGALTWEHKDDWDDFSHWPEHLWDSNGKIPKLEPGVDVKEEEEIDSSLKEDVQDHQEKQSLNRLDDQSVSSEMEMVNPEEPPDSQQENDDQINVNHGSVSGEPESENNEPRSRLRKRKPVTYFPEMVFLDVGESDNESVNVGSDVEYVAESEEEHDDPLELSESNAQSTSRYSKNVVTNSTREVSDVSKSADHGSSYHCPMCATSFDKRSNLTQHIANVHDNQPPRKKTLSRDIDGGSRGKDKNESDNVIKSVLQSLVQSVVHSSNANNTSHKCDRCEKYFSDESKLQEHAVSCDVRLVYACPANACGKSFSRRDNLKRHMLYTHVSVVLKGCQCEYDFAKHHSLSNTDGTANNQREE